MENDSECIGLVALCVLVDTGVAFFVIPLFILSQNFVKCKIYTEFLITTEFNLTYTKISNFLKMRVSKA